MTMNSVIFATAAAAPILVVLSGCSKQGDDNGNFNNDECEQYEMTFDSAEAVAAFLTDEQENVCPDAADKTQACVDCILFFADKAAAENKDNLTVNGEPWPKRGFTQVLEEYNDGKYKNIAKNIHAICDIPKGEITSAITDPAIWGASFALVFEEANNNCGSKFTWNGPDGKL